MTKIERRDVVRHRLALLSAARTVFAEQGVYAPLDAIVDAAGLGRGTLYRHFPDRAALLAAVVESEVDTLIAAMTPSPLEGKIKVFLEEAAAASERDAALAEAWRMLPPDEPAMVALRNRLKTALKEPLEAAIRAGRIRHDLTPELVLIAARMIGVGMRSAPDASTRKKVVNLIFDGLLRGSE